MRQPLIVPENLTFKNVVLDYKIELMRGHEFQKLAPVGLISLHYDWDANIEYKIWREGERPPSNTEFRQLFLDGRMFTYLRKLAGCTFTFEGYIKIYTDGGRPKHGVFRIANTALLCAIADSRS